MDKETTIQELNRKLAIWKGFTYDESLCTCEICTYKVWIPPNAKTLPNGRKEHIELPIFTQSTDLQFEWLVPELSYLQIEYYNKGYIVYVEYKSTQSNRVENTELAEAIARAIEQVIDGSK